MQALKNQKKWIKIKNSFEARTAKGVSAFFFFIIARFLRRKFEMQDLKVDFFWRN